MPTIHPPIISSLAPEGLSPTIRAKAAAAVLPATAGVLPDVKAGEAGSLNTPYSGYLKLFLGNPEALLEIFQKGPAALNQQFLSRLLPETAKNLPGSATKMIDALLYSPKSLTDPLFLKDYAAKLGLRLEGNWLDLVQQSSDNQRPAESLKSVLLKLADELTGLLKGGASLHPEELQKLTDLARFTETALRAIETQQVINVYSQENDNKYLLQIPLLFPGAIRNGEIFIELGKNGPRGGGKKKKCHVVMFLSMDQLGDMMVDASLNENTIACVFKFTDPEAQSFFSPLLAGLGQALRRIGYDSTALTSIVTEDLSVARQDHRREMMSEQDAVNLFA